jgi:hypothetical protein
MTGNTKGQLDEELIALNAELAVFVQQNPHAQILRAEGSSSNFVIDRPWGDEAVRINLPMERDKITLALNKVMLPPPFSAIWHHETSRFEVIWTAFRLSEDLNEVSNRSFTFEQSGLELTCSFGASSDELTTILKHCFPYKAVGSPPNFRNTTSFNAYASAREKKDEGSDGFPKGLDQPRSFWIEGLPAVFDEQAMIDIVRNINFFLRYYDHRSPTVLIHTEENAESNIQPVRYIEGKFPEKIVCGDLDETMLQFWSAAAGGNEILRYMLYWRVIEYAAFHFMNEKAKLSIRKILTSPSKSSDLDGTISKIAAAVSSSNMDDVPKFNELLKAAVDPSILWMEIEANKNAFSSSFIMDGGYEVPALVGVNETYETFSVQGLTKVSFNLRKIRNCLSHGQDQGSAGVILPTTRNLRRLRPWVHLIGKAAGEVVLYRDIT